MAYAPSKHVDRSAIPVIDISDLRGESPAALRRVADDLRRAAEEVGFFYVRNHGVPQALIDRVFATAKAFFGHPLEDKERVTISAQHRGFIRIGEAKMYAGANVDLKESYIWGLDVAEDDPDYRAGRPMIGPNRWPAFVPGMRETCMAYFDECNTLARVLLKAFATSLDVEADTFVRRFARPVTRLSMVYYPPQPPQLGDQQFGVAPHTDFGTITLLTQDDVGGLQVRDKNGDWVTAHPIEGCYVVNVGDLLARWTNDRFASTPHRVINSSGRARYAVAAFVDPDYDCLVAPVVRQGEVAHYAPTTVGDYVTGRFNQSFEYRKAR